MIPPLVSIIIPCFNAERWVSEAIESALAQTYRPVEVVAVDDGSTDGTRDVLGRYGESIKCLMGPNRGAAAARNHGVAVSTGSYIQFLDADDVLYPDKIRRCMDIVEGGQQGVVISAYETLEAGSVLPTQQPWPEGFSDMDPVVQVLCRPIQTSAPLHRRDVLDRVGGFDVSLPCAQEFDLHLRLACAGVPFQAIPDILFRVRKQPGSVSDNYVKVLTHAIPVAERAISALESNGMLTDERRKSFAEFMTRYGRHYLAMGRRSEGLACFARARKYHHTHGLNRFGVMYRLASCLVGPVAAEHMAYWTRSVLSGRREMTS